MKKIVAIFLSILLLITMLPIGIVSFAFTTEPEEITMIMLPSYNGTTLIGGENTIPNDVAEISKMSVSSIANEANIHFNNLFAITSIESGWSSLKIKIDGHSGRGIMYYVDAPVSSSGNLWLGTYLVHNNGKSAYKYQSAKWFTLSENDTAWQSNSIDHYGLNISGFKGYIYIPNSTLTAGQKYVECTNIEGVQYWLNTADGAEIPTGESIKVSAPAIVTGELDPNEYTFTMPSAKKVRTERGDVKYFAETNSNSNSTATTQPDYKIPAYNGTEINYSNLSIQNLTIGKLNGVVLIGCEISDKSADSGSGTLAAVQSKIGITNYPSFKFNGELLNFTLDSEVSPQNPAEIMHYIELPDNKSSDICFTWIFNNSDELKYYCTIYAGTAYLLAEGATEWIETEISTYNTNFPVGFKGYVKYNLNNIKAQSNSPAGDDFVFKADTEKYLYKSQISFETNISYSDTVYISTPIFVTKKGSVPFAAFVDGETSATRNLFSGAVVDRESLSNYIGIEGNENLIQGIAPEIDYRIPSYTGTKYEYGDYEFSRVRQFSLAGNIAKGYVIPQEVFSDGHADKDNAYTKLVDTTLGISNMPLFAITKTTGEPNNTEGKPVNLGVWHTDYKDERNAGPGAIIQYLKLPADLEKPLIQLTMNFFDRNLLVMNVVPYNGVIYYMDTNSTEWVSGKITKYWFELPQGFDGYIMIKTSSFKAQATGDDFDSYWKLYNYNVNVANLNNMTVLASAPFWVDNVGDTGYACYINDETNAVRNIFTGEILTFKEICSHDFKTATCTTPKTCKICGATSGSVVNHKHDNGTITKQATCTAKGTKTYKCTVCKKVVKTEPIDKIAHTYNLSVASTTYLKSAATCTSKAVYYKSCSCGAKGTATFQSGSKLAHDYETTTTKATLSKNGKTVKKCTVCGSKTTATIKYAKTFKLSTTSYTYNGKAKKPTVTVKDSAGKTIFSKYYTVTYKNNKKVGKATVTIKMKGNYKGTKTLTFTIKPAKTTVSKLTAGKKSVTVSIKKKSTQVTGYQIQYSTSKKFTSAKTKTVSSYKTTKSTIKSLKAKKTYYVRVRTYKTANGKKYYSGWSDYKKVKTK